MMDAIDYERGTGFCAEHNMMKMQVGQRNICAACDVPTGPGSGIVSTKADPGTAKIEQMLSAAGIVTPKSQPKVVNSAQIQTPGLEIQKIVAPPSITMALTIMKSLPMPSDVKQFKKIQKIIRGLEELLTEEVK